MIYQLPLTISNLAYDYPPCSNMSISAVNYYETFLPKPDFIITLGITTYDALQQKRLELKINALSVHFNLGGATHGHLRLFRMNTKYAMMPNILYIRYVNPDIPLIPNNDTRISLYEIKRVYDKNLQVFHELCEFKHFLIHQFVTAVDEKCIISMKNRTTGYFRCNIRNIFAYLLAKYGKYHRFN